MPSSLLLHNSGKNIVRICDNENELQDVVKEMKLEKTAENFSDKGIVYLGIKNNQIDNIHLISTLNSYGWVIRNQLVIKIKESKSWYPVYLIVKDSKKTEYAINMDAVRVDHKDQQEENWEDIDFVGYKAANSLPKSKEEGLIVKILDKYDDGMPSEVIVKWENGKHTKECVKHRDHLNDTAFSFYCPKCEDQLSEFYDEDNKINCPNCENELWTEAGNIPKLKIEGDYYPQKSAGIDKKVEAKNTKKDYDGKFKDAKPINLGASPGARSSTQEKYFSVQRYYDFPRRIIAELLNIMLKEKKLTKKKFTEMFGKEYLHTVGHWFRKDKGGSLPTPDDLNAISQILDIPENYQTMVNCRCMVLQAVKKSHKGKNPGDYLEFTDDEEVINFLKKTLC